ncbi:MAG: phosphatidylserine decarboxylase [Acidobacteria bacterium]|nr:phosphatidylserine decarboxylase [Acidobacteriota bacterium]
MRIDPAGWPFVGGALALAAVAVVSLGAAAGLALVACAAFFLFFFRDPDRQVTPGADVILAPADGRVIVAGAAVGPGAPEGQWLQVSMFLSPVDVHVNRMPVSGRVTRVNYHPGRFLPAYRSDAGHLNEYTEVWVDHDAQPIVVRQVVGVLARRIVCRTRPGEDVTAGQRFGVMKFGSRMDVFVPTTAELTVNIGDRVTAAVTVIARLQE